MTFNACLLPSSKASGRKSQCLQTCAAGVGFIWGWVKSQNLWIYHISGNKRPIASYYRVPNVPGFWPIAIYALCLYSTTQKQLSNSSFGGGLLIKHGFWTQVIMFDRIDFNIIQPTKKRSFQEQEMNIDLGQHVFPLIFRIANIPFLGTQLLKVYSYCHVHTYDAEHCWLLTNRTDSYMFPWWLRHLYMLY